MKPFELRLAELHSRNSRHLRNLENFMADKARLSRISKEEQTLLEHQVSLMHSLETVLESRMIIHNIPV